MPNSKELQKFTDAMTEKRERRMKEHPERPADPWNKYPPTQIQVRLIEEFEEWREAATKKSQQEEADELVDIANFCFFRWTQIKKGK